MAEKFNLAGLKAEYLTSKNSKDRDKIRDQFKKKSSIIYLW
jgi:bifunctional pyridoxal-dependent enzyme with beta-cystathionase and maltose regulon repressor activities